jgi:hypothetical protein
MPLGQLRLLFLMDLMSLLRAFSVAHEIDADPVQIGIRPSDQQTPGEAQAAEFREGFVNNVSSGLEVGRAGAKMPDQPLGALTIEKFNARSPVLVRKVILRSKSITILSSFPARRPTVQAHRRLLPRAQPQEAATKNGNRTDHTAVLLQGRAEKPGVENMLGTCAAAFNRRGDLDMRVRPPGLKPVRSSSGVLTLRRVQARKKV